MSNYFHRSLELLVALHRTINALEEGAEIDSATARNIVLHFYEHVASTVTREIEAGRWDADEASDLLRNIVATTSSEPFLH